MRDLIICDNFYSNVDEVRAFALKQDFNVDGNYPGHRTKSFLNESIANYIGEIVGGSQREERLDVLEKRIEELDIDDKELWWYLDLRKYGSVKHSGFGLGLERLILFITGMNNIRDVIPFPRTPKNADF